MRLHKGYLAKYETAYYVFVPSTGMYDMFIIKQKYVSPRNYSTKKCNIVPTGLRILQNLQVMVVPQT